jgi:multidrug transporter EmrE-like cation transporter
MNLLYGIIWGVLAQATVFLQLQGSLKLPILKDNFLGALMLGIPISFFFMKSVKNLVLFSGGKIWPSYIIGFTIGTAVFAILSSLVFGEHINTKTLVCLGLCLAVVLIQIFWK